MCFRTCRSSRSRFAMTMKGQALRIIRAGAELPVASLTSSSATGLAHRGRHGWAIPLVPPRGYEPELSANAWGLIAVEWNDDLKRAIHESCRRPPCGCPRLLALPIVL